MTTVIDFGDPRGLADLGIFVGRAKVAQPSGAVRLQLAAPTMLVLTVAVLEGAGLLGDGTVLGLRAVPVRGSTGPVDSTVAFASVSERLARAGSDTTTFSVPPTTVARAWAALTPPRDGWERVGTLSADAVNQIAAQGISEVAQGTPEHAGGPAVTALRRRVWGAMSDTAPPIAAGLAFGAHVLGFVGDGEDVAVATCGRWTRLSSARGHVLVR